MNANLIVLRDISKLLRSYQWFIQVRDIYR